MVSLLGVHVCKCHVLVKSTEMLQHRTVCVTVTLSFFDSLNRPVWMDAIFTDGQCEVDVESDAILPGAMGMEKTLISRISQPHEIP